jgi:pimeloyl-ACP methyl ester carboxylesterase
MAGDVSQKVYREETLLSDGTRLAGWVVGADDRPSVLLIAGGGADHRGWRCILPELCRSQAERTVWAGHGRSLADGLRVAVFDQRGSGESSEVLPATSAELMASDAIAVGRALLGEKFAVVGESMGGMAALHAALIYPGAVTALGLLATTAGGGGLTWPSDAFIGAATAGEGIFDQAGARDGLTVAVSEKFRTERPALFDAMADAAMTQPRSDQIGAAQASVFLNHDVATRLAEIQIPVLVMCGTEDQAHPLPNSQFLASNIPGAHLVVLEGAGHIIDAEDPQRVIDETTRLVSRTNGGG